jgi:hypothetical protein
MNAIDKKDPEDNIMDRDLIMGVGVGEVYDCSPGIDNNEMLNDLAEAIACY